MMWSFLFDTGFQATDMTSKEFYIETYFPAHIVTLPMITRP
jgi:hypothetical protein